LNRQVKWCKLKVAVRSFAQGRRRFNQAHPLINQTLRNAFVVAWRQNGKLIAIAVDQTLVFARCRRVLGRFPP